MRRFSADYLADTRAGMWADDRSALAPLALPDRERVLDVGAGAGAFTRVLREESSGEVVAVDADRSLLSRVAPPTALGDATRLPVRDGAADLVACQALLVNLPDPAGAVSEFARVSCDLVAAVEPDNGAVSVASSVGAEEPLARRAREAYVAGVETDVTLGGDVAGLFADAGLDVVGREVYHHARVVEPPYDDAALEGARRKATAERIRDARATLEAGGMTSADVDALAADWRAMGETAIEQMQDGAYRRAEVVPFHVTVGRVPDA